MVLLQTFKCICLSCAHRDFTLDRHVSVWWHGQCCSQSVIDAARVLKVNVLGYVCNHGSPRNKTQRRMPYFLHPCERLASTFQNLTSLVPDALLSSLVSTSPRPLRWTDNTCFRGWEHRSLQRLVPRGTMVSYITWDVLIIYCNKTASIDLFYSLYYTFTISLVCIMLQK